jgi:hypothetical protein
MSPRAAPTAYKGLALCLAVLALALKVVLPAGVMIDPAVARAGQMVVVLCSGDGPVTATVGADGALIDHPTDDGPSSSGHDHPCVFAATPAPPPPAMGPALHAPLTPALPVIVAVATAPAPGRGLAAPPPPATAPPILI